MAALRSRYPSIPSTPRTRSLRRRSVLSTLSSVALAALIAPACLDRPVAPVEPQTTNIVVKAITQNGVDKIDLVLMIDNSLSMAEKQKVLASAVPQLVKRLVDPLCVNPNDAGDRKPSPGPGADCPDGYNREFRAVDDIHVGVISSSLGGHGGDLCSPASGQAFNPEQDDHAHLVPTVRPADALDSYQGLGFLAWDPNAKQNPPGEANLDTLIQDVRSQVEATRELGCGFESQLESWYRFLIDPEPPGSVVRDPANPSQAIVQGVDDVVLQQRAAFLRPDSLVAIVMLTDENDCSIVDGGAGWLAAQTRTDGGSELFLPRATSACATDPNSACCRSCGLLEQSPPNGCAPLGADPECAKGNYDAVGDALNLRCYDEKRRFGIDFLYPTERYVDGLTKSTVVNRAGQSVDNPLFRSGGKVREKSLVFLAGIVGVPWQDLATDDTLRAPDRLKYLSGTELRQQGRWNVILSNPNNPGARPDDALMWETPDDRTTLGAPPNPITGDPLAPATSTTLSNPINGHEYLIPKRNDLQYSCIFKLPVPHDCTNATGPCDCNTEAQSMNKPLCEGTLQTYAKAYPGLRELSVLKGFGDVTGADNAIVASICPKIIDDPSTPNHDPSNPDYGYNPAVGAIIDQLVPKLGAGCLPRPLDVDDQGYVPCAVVEAAYSPDAACPVCDASTGRAPLVGARATLAGAVREQLAATGQCGPSMDRACTDYCLCEVLPAGGASDPATGQTTLVNPAQLLACQSGATDFTGYCYIDPSKGIGDPSLVSECDATEKRKLRFAEGTPANGAVLFMACLGAAVSE